MQNYTIPIFSNSAKAIGVVKAWDENGVFKHRISWKSPPSSREIDIWFITQSGPIAPNEKVSLPIVGVIITVDGQCIAAGKVSGARVDLEREKMHIRMRGMLSNTKKNLSIKQHPTPEAIDNVNNLSLQSPNEIAEETERAQQVTPEPLAQTAQSMQPSPPIDEKPKSIAKEPEPIQLPESYPSRQTNIEAKNSEALTGILERAKDLFPERNDTIVAPQNKVSPLASHASSWGDEADAILAMKTPEPDSSAPPSDSRAKSEHASNPFPNTFPHTQWKKVTRGQGQGWYLEGIMYRNNETFLITAVPGEYRPIPPRNLQGFNRYIKSRDGGFWVRVMHKKP